MGRGWASSDSGGSRHIRGGGGHNRHFYAPRLPYSGIQYCPPKNPVVPIVPFFWHAYSSSLPNPLYPYILLSHACLLRNPFRWPTSPSLFPLSLSPLPLPAPTYRYSLPTLILYWSSQRPYIIETMHPYALPM